MPFKKMGKDKYVSPSGKHYTLKQVVAYHASEGWRHVIRKSPKRKKSMSAR